MGRRRTVRRIWAAGLCRRWRPPPPSVETRRTRRRGQLLPPPIGILELQIELRFLCHINIFFNYYSPLGDRLNREEQEHTRTEDDEDCNGGLFASTPSAKANQKQWRFPTSLADTKTTSRILPEGRYFGDARFGGAEGSLCRKSGIGIKERPEERQNDSIFPVEQPFSTRSATQAPAGDTSSGCGET